MRNAYKAAPYGISQINIRFFEPRILRLYNTKEDRNNGFPMRPENRAGAGQTFASLKINIPINTDCLDDDRRHDTLVP
jgi:hypothetical protein